MIRLKIRLVLGLVAMCATSTVAEWNLSRRTIDAGGTMRSEGGTLELSGSIGQPEAGRLQSASFALTGGFWVEIPTGDCGEDGSVSSIDLTEIDRCAQGPDYSLDPRACGCLDFDRDGDIDLLDIAEFQIAVNGQ